MDTLGRIDPSPDDGLARRSLEIIKPESPDVPSAHVGGVVRQECHTRSARPKGCYRLGYAGEPRGLFEDWLHFQNRASCRDLHQIGQVGVFPDLAGLETAVGGIKICNAVESLRDMAPPVYGRQGAVDIERNELPRNGSQYLDFLQLRLPTPMRIPPTHSRSSPAPTLARKPLEGAVGTRRSIKNRPTSVNNRPSPIFIALRIRGREWGGAPSGVADAVVSIRRGNPEPSDNRTRGGAYGAQTTWRVERNRIGAWLN